MAEGEEVAADRRWRITRAAQAIVRCVKWVLKRGGLAALFVGFAALWLWTAIGLAVYEPWPTWLRVPAVLLWLTLPVAGRLWVPRLVPIKEFTRIVLAVAIIAGFVATQLLWDLWSPRNDRDWIELQARTPRHSFHGTTVTIENVRNSVPGVSGDGDGIWETRTYDVSALRTIDMIICPFAWDRRGMAHTFLSFGFEGGEHVAVSVEARYEEGEGFGPIKGLFRGYEVIYIIGDERDIVGLRTNVRGEPVYLYPLEVPPALAQAIFVMMITRSQRVGEHPEWYNLITNCCASNMVRHIAQAYQGEPSLDPRLLIPGYIDDYAAEIGLLRIPGPLEEVRDQFLVNDRNTVMTDSIAWSRQIRGE